MKTATDTGGKSASRLTIKAAADLLGMTRQNLHTTYIKTGKVAAGRAENGAPYIEFCELQRAFPSLNKDAPSSTTNVKDLTEKTDNTLHDNTLILQEKIDDLTRQLREKEEAIRKAEEREIWLQGQVEKAFMLLEHKKPEEPSPAPERLPFWKRPLW